MKKSSRSLLLAFVFLAGAIYLFDIKEIKFYLIPSDSMEPTLKKADYVFGFSARTSELRRGDIVVFSSGSRNDFYVKRVVGLPGEELKIVDGFVFINGEKLDEPYVPHRGEEMFGPVKIPNGRVFLLGDNRTNSFDSRWFGPVPVSLLETKILYIYNPVTRIGAVR